MDLSFFSGEGAAPFAMYGYLALFVVLFLGEVAVPLPVPGHAALFVAGYFASQGGLNLGLVILVGVFAAVLGASALYYLARVGGEPLLHRLGRLLRVSDARFERAETAFKRRSYLFLPASRFMPGMRIYGSALAGVLGISYPRFFAITAVSAVLWVGGMSSVGMLLKGNGTILIPLITALSGAGFAAIAFSSLWSRLRPQAV